MPTEMAIDRALLTLFRHLGDRASVLMALRDMAASDSCGLYDIELRSSARTVANWILED